MAIADVNGGPFTMLESAVKVFSSGRPHGEECSSVVAPLILVLEMLPDRLNHVTGAQHHHVALAVEGPFRKVAVVDQLAEIVESGDHPARGLQVVVRHRGHRLGLLRCEERPPPFGVCVIWLFSMCEWFECELIRCECKLKREILEELGTIFSKVVNQFLHSEHSIELETFRGLAELANSNDHGHDKDQTRNRNRDGLDSNPLQFIQV